MVILCVPFARADRAPQARVGSRSQGGSFGYVSPARGNACTVLPERTATWAAVLTVTSMQVGSQFSGAHPKRMPARGSAFAPVPGSAFGRGLRT